MYECDCKTNGAGCKHDARCAVWKPDPTPTERFIEALRAFHRAAAELDSVGAASTEVPLSHDAGYLAEFLEKQIAEALGAWNLHLNPGDKPVFRCSHEGSEDNCELYTTNSDEYAGREHVCDHCAERAADRMAGR